MGFCHLSTNCNKNSDVHTEEAKLKMRGTKNMSPEHLVKIREHFFKINSKRALHIEVFDMENGSKVEYASALSAAASVFETLSRRRRGTFFLIYHDILKKK
jgi:hypothetical protein